MFKKPITVDHVLSIPTEEAKEVITHARDQFVPIIRTVGISLLVGIPCAILFGFAANVASEVAIDRLTSS